MKTNIVNKKELWLLQAPAFNFELDEDQLLKKALSAGFVKQVSEDQFEINRVRAHNVSCDLKRGQYE